MKCWMMCWRLSPLKYFADRWLLPVSDVFDVDNWIFRKILPESEIAGILCQRGPAVSVIARLQMRLRVRECPASEKPVREFGAR